MTWRRLNNLVRHLPAESATMTALRVANPSSVTDDGPDPAEGRWSQAEMLLAAAVDTLRCLQWDYLCAHLPEGKRPARPDPIRRPGVERTEKKKPRLSDAQADFLWRHINGEPLDPDSPIQFKVIDGGGGG